MAVDSIQNQLNRGNQGDKHSNETFAEQLLKADKDERKDKNKYPPNPPDHAKKVQSIHSHMKQINESIK